MSSKDLAVSVRGLSKSYTIAHEHEVQSTLAETLLQRARSPFRRPTKETFRALKDVSFNIKKGEVVGIIGRNGAGKSTLLKILSRITEPTSGEIDLYGRVGSLLEVGTGFHPELTGRENIFLNGAILGMPRREIARQFDAIVEFAEIERFLDTPVKRYSSGMYVRLAFAVAAHLRSDILVVDEVLAVGDAQFQRKCLGKMGDVAHEGRTVLFVSHQMGTVSALCGKGILLNAGTVQLIGNVQEVVSGYLNLSDVQNLYAIDEKQINSAKNQVLSVQIEDENRLPRSEFSFSESVCLTVKALLPKPATGLLLGIGLDNLYQSRVFTAMRESSEVMESNGGKAYEARLQLPKGIIAPNRYSFTVALFEHNSVLHDQVQNICPITIVDDGTSLSRFEGIDYGNVILDAQWNP